MNPNERMARRYHWLSASLQSFMEEPHTSVCGRNQGLILNLTDKLATPTKAGILELTKETPDKLMREVSIILPRHHEVKAKDVNLKRLGAALILAHETNVADMESLLLLEGVGPRTLQSLTLVSEVIHGTPSRFSDPARFSFAHGGKDGWKRDIPPTTTLMPWWNTNGIRLTNMVGKRSLGMQKSPKAKRERNLAFGTEMNL